MANDGAGGGATGGYTSNSNNTKGTTSAVDQSIQRLKDQQAGSQGSVSANPKDPLVYLGRSTPTNMQGSSGYYGALGAGAIQEADKTGTVSSVSNEYFSWSQKTKDKFLTQLAMTGRDTSGLSDGQLSQLWGAYVGQASQYYAAGKSLTPWDIISKDMKARQQYLNTPRTETVTGSQVQLSTGADAHAIFLQAAQSLLGRDPTKSEIKTFQSTLNSYERANPATTTTTKQFLGDTQTGEQSTTSGGVSADARNLLAMNDVKKDPEYGAYQAATNGMNWLMEMI